ncbi:mfs transporter [Diplodia corticola]|uniref:Mfs transporter n=1 Tax=Diplodia corticola TaxID=236234 RepID=A0A1J9RSC8_9PEZI|nr:mfs transporter [Diplodia corticola]OJD30429.1 mfs transporter [Diplodia corticola]
MSNRETESLLHSGSNETRQSIFSNSRGILCVIATLLGALIASADESLMITMYTIVGSDLRQLQEAPWLLISYNLGYSIALPICGKLAQIYGRKRPLLFCYALFIIGNLWVGLAGSLWYAIAGRLVTGLGGAGLIGLVSVIITGKFDSHPGIALFRSFVTVITTVGRSGGPALGAWLSDLIGWRWSFLSQCPVSIVCALLIAFSLPSDLAQSERPGQERKSGFEAIRQIDFAGVLTFIVAVSAFVIFIDLGGDRLAWTHPAMIGLAAIFVSFSITFVLVEKFWATNPLTPLSLLMPTSGGGFCTIQIFVFLGRLATITNLTPFYIYTLGASNTMAALYMVPSSVGAASGGLASGIVFTRFYRYRLPSLICTLVAIASYSVIAIRWSDGLQSPLELSYIFIVGVCFGWTLSAQFVGMSMFTPKRYAAEGITAYYLSQQLGSILGTNLSTKLLRNLFRRGLRAALPQEENLDRDAMIEDIIKDSRFYQWLPESTRAVVRREYLSAFKSIPLLSIGANIVATGLMFLVPETGDTDDT